MAEEKKETKKKGKEKKDIKLEKEKKTEKKAKAAVSAKEEKKAKNPPKKKETLYSVCKNNGKKTSENRINEHNDRPDQQTGKIRGVEKNLQKIPKSHHLRRCQENHVPDDQYRSQMPDRTAIAQFHKIRQSEDGKLPYRTSKEKKKNEERIILFFKHHI